MSNSIAGPACKFRRPGKWTRGQNQWLSDEYTRPSDPVNAHGDYIYIWFGKDFERISLHILGK